MKKMTIGLLTAAAIAAMPVAGSALTFKKGQVLGSDGQIHDGASPDVRTRLIARAQDGGKSAGVTAGQLYVVVRDTITFVPITDIAGKSEETVKEIVVEKVTETITEALTEEALADVAGIAAAEAAAATKEAWENISAEDLAEATAYAAEFAAQEAAKVIEHQNIDSQLQDLIDSGATEAEIDQFIENNPMPE